MGMLKLRLVTWGTWFLAANYWFFISETRTCYLGRLQRSVMALGNVIQHQERK